jgi:photosystem II stability/assembly factor-like uncharacterized protein
MRALLLIAATALALPMQAQWTIQTTPTTADLRGIANAGNGIAWASGTEGTVLRTTDTGKTWHRCPTPPNADHLDFRGIQAFDANTAIVMSSGKGDLSRLYKTTDGCQTWILALTNPDADGFWDAFVVNRKKPYLPSDDWQRHMFGVLIGDPVNGIFSLWETRDSGTTWQRWNTGDIKHLARAMQGESLFAASNESLQVPSTGGFAFVTGGGSSRLCQERGHSPFDAEFWMNIECRSTGFTHSESSGAFAVESRKVSGYQDMLVVGGDYSHPDAPGYAVYFAGTPRLFLGYEKPLLAVTPPHGYRSAVAYAPTTKTWITVGPNGTDISTDDGRNWHPLKPSPTDTPDADRNWNALALPYVVGPHGRIGILNPTALK